MPGGEVPVPNEVEDTAGGGGRMSALIDPPWEEALDVAMVVAGVVAEISEKFDLPSTCGQLSSVPACCIAAA